MKLAYKCIATKCRKDAVDGHAVCQFHLILEITLTAVVGMAGVWGFLWLILRIPYR